MVKGTPNSLEYFTKHKKPNKQTLGAVKSNLNDFTPVTFKLSLLSSNVPLTVLHNMHTTTPSLTSALNTVKQKRMKKTPNLRWYVLSQIPIKQTRKKKNLEDLETLMKNSTSSAWEKLLKKSFNQK